MRNQLRMIVKNNQLQNWMEDSWMHPCGHLSIKFDGHVTLRLRIHFSYLIQPSVSKTCSFINSCIHPSPFWAFGKIITAFTLQVHTHFFFKNWLWSMNLFQRKPRSYLFSKACWLFSRKIYFFVLGCFCFFFLSFF